MPSQLDALEAQVDQVVAIAWADEPVATLGDSVVRMQRIVNKVDAGQVALLGAFDASNEYRAQGHPSVATFVAAHSRADRRAIRRRVGLARRLRTMPETAAALGTGAISLAHAYCLARVNTPKVREDFARAESLLVTSATRMDFDAWVRGLRAWRDAADPDGADQRTQAGEERREAHASRTFDGLVRLDAWLDAIGGTEFLAELHRLERRLFEADWAEARARIGDTATQHDLRRTAPQRRADAIVEMARRSATTDTPGQAPNWVLNVVMDWATFCAETGRRADDPGPDPRQPFDPNQPPPPTPPQPPAPNPPDPEGATDPGPVHEREHENAPRDGQRLCELEDGTPIAPSLALSLGLRGRVRGVIFGPKGNVLHHGATQRLFTGNLREAIILRDRFCRGTGCGVPGRDCEIDHDIRYTDGGPTDEWNGRCYCDTHQHLKEDLLEQERQPQRA